MGRIEQPRLGDVDEIVEKNIEKDRKVTCFLNGGLIVWHQFWEGLEGKKAAQDTDLDYWAVPSLGFHPKRNESGPIPDGCVRRVVGAGNYFSYYFIGGKLLREGALARQHTAKTVDS